MLQKTPDTVSVRLHGGLSLAAVIGLAINTRTVWTDLALPYPALAMVLTLGYGVMLVAAVPALCARAGSTLARVDIVVLGTAVVIRWIALLPAISGARPPRVDEGMLMDRATRAVAAGQNPYVMTWPDLDPETATRLMNGGVVAGFGYPPFGIELGAAAQLAVGSSPGIVLVSGLALVATAIIAFRAAPEPLRPLATLGILGTGMLTAYAENAYPSMIALPFLCLAVWHWPSIGRGGRLGRPGVLRAVAIGLAVSTHQLGWFLSVFLLAGLILLRRGELPWRGVALVLSRYAGVAAGVALAVNLPFLARDPAAWAHGVFEPLTQHAVPHGQGVMAVSYHLIGGSGALDFYGHAAAGLLLGLLGFYALNITRLGPAAVVLPWLVFWVAMRSQDGYWVLTMPLWIVGLCTTRRRDFDGAYRIRRGVESVAFFVPAAVCLLVAMAAPQPLSLRPATEAIAGQEVRRLTVAVTNRSPRPLSPHFAVTTGVYLAQFWSVESGPATLAPDVSATYVLVPPPNRRGQPVWKPQAGQTALLRAVTDGPQTLSSVRIRIRPPLVVLPSRPPG